MADILAIFFNQPSYSDVILNVNGMQFHLASRLFEKYTHFFKSQPNGDIQQLSTSAELVMSLVSKNIITINDPQLKLDVVTNVLKSAYGSPLKIDNDNAKDIIDICLKLEMKATINECFGVWMKNISADDFIDSLLRRLLKNHYY